MKVNSASFRLATEADKHLPAFDNTKLVAGNTCPTWGIIRYAKHKTFNASSRALPLEMGSAMHDVFAWVRLCTLMVQPSTMNKPLDFRERMFNYHMLRLFGPNRAAIILENLPHSIPGLAHGMDHVAVCKFGAFNVIETSGYADDPSDRRRTVSNMEEAALAYIDRWRWINYIWQQEPDNPEGFVGIEIPFDIVVDLNDGEMVFRYTGKIDGIQIRGDDANSPLYIGENKTASRLNDAWSMSFALSSQITGYCVAGSIITEQDVRKAMLFGLSIPLPKSYDYGGIVSEILTRYDYHITRWVSWVAHTVEMFLKYEDTPLDAPMYTHSCSRYFRPCPFIPLCDAPQDERASLLEDMDVQEWSPLHKVETE